MATPTYTLISSVTLTSSASSVTFSSIAAGGDLAIHINANSTDNGGDAIKMQFNSDTAYQNYQNVFMEGNGTGAYGNIWATDGIANSYNYVHFSGATLRGAIVWNIARFSETNKHKSTIGRSGRASSALSIAVGKWANTAAITTIKFVYGNPAASFGVGSTFFLYRIEK